MLPVCPSCFFKPAPVRGSGRGEPDSMIICSSTRTDRAPASGDALGMAPLRCEYCDHEVWLDSHYLAWYA